MVDIGTGLSEVDRKSVAVELSRLLADSYTLYLKSQNYHWNVTGPMFQTLHLMFEEHYVELAEAVDEIAERIRALGEPAPASYGEFARLSSIPEEPSPTDALAMVASLVEAHAIVIGTARDTLVAAEQANDAATADLATRRIDIHEKTSWMLRSLLG